ncbi:hypothetical protein MTR67_000694 [Solanum verrucosum]|uniref:DUF4283 domain-containing protein n=1 Tax=Solanum verrucosum TaxID=315347 RepID=A0AAF0PST3_SOLVR|nr:hypothetical protein MTR67_000694 [Solanum verrucosum]
MQKLQFSDVGTSTHSTPVEPKNPQDMNRAGKVGKTLSYVPLNIKDGRKCVEIMRDDLKEQEEYWKTAHIGFVIGDTPYLKSMEGFVQNIWKTVNTPQIMLHDEGYFVFRFDSMADCEAILQDGPYYFNNKTLILQRWELNFEFNPDCITTIPLWVTFPGLPVGYWSSETLSKVASAIGKPLHTDVCTTSMTRISYACVLVEIDVAQPLVDVIDISTPYSEF